MRTFTFVFGMLWASVLACARPDPPSSPIPSQPIGANLIELSHDIDLTNNSFHHWAFAASNNNITIQTCGDNTPYNDCLVFQPPSGADVPYNASFSYTSDTVPGAPYNFTFGAAIYTEPGEKTPIGSLVCTVANVMDATTSTLTTPVSTFGDIHFNLRGLSFEAAGQTSTITCAYSKTTANLQLGFTRFSLIRTA